jgi:hypothetical protein
MIERTLPYFSVDVVIDGRKFLFFEVATDYKGPDDATAPFEILHPFNRFEELERLVQAK